MIITKYHCTFDADLKFQCLKLLGHDGILKLPQIAGYTLLKKSVVSTCF